MKKSTRIPRGVVMKPEVDLRNKDMKDSVNVGKRIIYG
jgi:hypothetical protein